MVKRQSRSTRLATTRKKAANRKAGSKRLSNRKK